MKKIIGIISAFLAIFILITGLEVRSYDEPSGKELEDQVVVLTNYNDDVINYIGEEFTKKTGIDVKIDKFNSDAEIEGKINNVDIILGATKDTMENLTSKNLLHKYIPEWSDDIDEYSKDKDGYWYGMSKRPIGIFYDESVWKAQDAPTTFESLSNIKYRGSIIVPNVNSIEFKYMLFAMLNQSDIQDEYEIRLNALNGFKMNIGAYKNSCTDVIKSVEAKEGSIGFAYIDDINRAISNGQTLKIVNDGIRYPYSVDGMAIVKNAKNLNSAELFEEFAAGPVVQYEMSKKYGMYPCNQKSMSLNTDLGDVQSLFFNINTEEYSNNIDSIVERYNGIVDIIENR